MNEPHTWAIVEVSECRDDSHVERWFPTVEQARGYARRYIDRYHDAWVGTPNEDGTLSWEPFHWEPMPYTGPIATARICRAKPTGLVLHRTPIDCATPRPSQPLDEDYNWRIVANSITAGETPEPPSMSMSCRCGEWQDIEGEPNKVAELAREYPYPPVPPCPRCDGWGTVEHRDDKAWEADGMIPPRHSCPDCNGTGEARVTEVP